MHINTGLLLIIAVNRGTDGGHTGAVGRRDGHTRGPGGAVVDGDRGAGFAAIHQVVLVGEWVCANSDLVARQELKGDGFVAFADGIGEGGNIQLGFTGPIGKIDEVFSAVGRWICVDGCFRCHIIRIPGSCAPPGDLVFHMQAALDRVIREDAIDTAADDDPTGIPFVGVVDLFNGKG